MSKIKNDGVFPSQTAGDSVIKSSEYGLKVAKAMEAEWFDGPSGSGRFDSSQAGFHKLRLYARGEQPTSKYKNELAINGDLSYLNLDWKPVPIIPKFVDIVVNGISDRLFDIKAYSQDDESIKRKTDYVEKLLSDMRNKELLDTIEASFGLSLYKTDKEELPSSEEEISLKMQLEYKDSIEVACEEVISNVFDHNKFDLIRRRVNYDLATIGIGAVRNTFNTAEGIKLDYVDPANLIYSYTESPYFDDVYYIGEVRRMTIAQLKKDFPRLTAEQLEEIQDIGSSSIGSGGKKNSKEHNDTNVVSVMYFEYMTSMNQVWKIKETASGASKAIEKDDTFKPPKDERSRFEKVDRSLEALYCGVKVVGCDHVLKWELAENMVRPKSDTTKTKFTYSIVAPRVYKGKIESLVGRMIGFADAIQITHLKLQQILARMVPDGIFLDADAMSEIDLGGGTHYNPQEALDMYFQTGSVIGRTMTSDGDFNNSKLPIQELNHSGAGNKIQSLITAYNYYLQMIRDVTGLNEARDGSMPDEKSLVGLQKLAAANSNTATRHIVQSSLYLALYQAEVTCLRVSDVLEHGNTTSSFITSIGRMNVSTLKELENLHLHDFAIFLELAPDEEEKQILENNIQVALNKEQIYLEDAIDIREVKNIKLANQLLKLRRKKKQDLDRQMQMENIQAQAESNAQAAQHAAQVEMQKEEALASTKINVNKAQLGFDIQKLEREAAIKKQLMDHEFAINMRLKEMDNQVINKKEEEKENKESRMAKMKASHQSELIDQKQNNKPPKNFESSGMDTLSGFGIENYDPK